MSNYWERRAARDIYEQMEDAEAVASQIAKAYQQASDYLIEKAEDVFEKYRSKYGLTEQEAWNTLNTLQDSTSLEELRQSLAQAASGSEKAALRQQLEAPAYRFRIERLQDMMDQVDSVMNNVYKVENRQTKSFLKQLAEKAYYKTIFNIQKRTKLGFSFSHVSEKQIDKVLNMNWSGKHFSQRIWRNTKKLAKKIKEELLVSLLTGRTDRETAEVIREECGGGANEARRLVRTESAFVSGELTGEAYKECDVEKYRYVSVLDLKTSKICRELDGKVFNVKDKQAGKNYPPMHPWCRSTTIAELPAKVMAKLKRRARDPKTGKNIIIPATMTYKEWYAKYVKGNPEAEAKETAELNKSADRKQYDKYKEILGDDAPKNFADFQDMKYNDGEEWRKTKKQYAVFNSIEKKAWSPEFKEKCQNAFKRFEKNGVMLSAHALSRLPRLNKQGYPELSESDLTKACLARPNFTDGETRAVVFDKEKQIAIVKNSKTNEIISIVRRKNAKELWEPCSKSG